MLPHGERTLDAIDALLAQKARQRSGLLEASEALNRRYGELKQELAQAVHLRDFDELKLRYEQACTQQEEYAREYARLLLAKRMLESAIAAWGEQKPARGVPPGQQTVSPHDRRTLGEGFHDRGRTPSA